MLDIDTIKDLNRMAGGHFFDPATVKMFHSRALDTVYEGPGGVFFVTSEKMDVCSARIYTVRVFDRLSSAITTHSWAKRLDNLTVAKCAAATAARGL